MTEAAPLTSKFRVEVDKIVSARSSPNPGHRHTVSGRPLADQPFVDGLLLDGRKTHVLPRHDGSMLSIAALVHALLFAAVIGVGMRPVRLAPAGSAAGSSIGAYVSDAIDTVARSAKPAPQTRSALATKTAASAPREHEQSGGESAGAAGVNQAGPVRIGAGGTLSLIKRVEPLYPPIMRSARMTGTVVLDAVIHADGSIGDVTVLRSTNDAFAQSAIAAVKLWRYSPPGFEAVLTVTVNYTLT